MFPNQFQTVEDVVKESKIVEDVVDPLYPIVFHPISLKTI